MAMFAPCLANSSTMALPMPLLPPVTMATLSFKSMTELLRWLLSHRQRPTQAAKSRNSLFPCLHSSQCGQLIEKGLKLAIIVLIDERDTYRITLGEFAVAGKSG